MNTSLKISVIIPTKNEVKNIVNLLSNLPDLPEISEVILVDGHSEDGTVEVAKEHMPELITLYQDGKGKGNAITCGAKIATGDYFCILDADLSQRPEELASYVNGAKAGYQLIKGSRFMRGGKTEENTLLRNVITKTANFIANVAWGTRFSDICYGMFLIERKKYLELDMQSQSWDVEWELMVKSHRKGLRILEVPAIEHERLFGDSKVPNYFRTGRIIARRVFSEALKRWRKS